MSDRKQVQAAKAEQFRRQHHSGRLLLLPNIWDALGARLIARMGYPSVATASASIALANGYADGEHIPFHELLVIVGNITFAVDLPLTVDIERGYATTDVQLAENIRLLLDQGAVGINIEDSNPDRRNLASIRDQCRKIELIREAGLQYGVPIVINARTDAYLADKGENAFKTALERGIAYKNAGADCIYPVLIGSYEEIESFIDQVKAPVNVLLIKSIADLQQLEHIGVSRVSLGPALLSHVLTTMKDLTEGLLSGESKDWFSRELLSRDFLDSLL